MGEAKGSEQINRILKWLKEEVYDHDVAAAKARRSDDLEGMLIAQAKSDQTDNIALKIIDIDMTVREERQAARKQQTKEKEKTHERSNDAGSS